MTRVLWAALIWSIISVPARSQEVVSDSFHLSGSHVVRHGPIVGVTEMQRVLIHGVRLPNGGCRYSGEGPGAAGWSEWEAEVDPDTCT